MGNNYIFSLTPTFTQGLLLGQLSILLLLALVFKYLFFLPQRDESETSTFHPFTKPDNPSQTRLSPKADTFSNAAESANWFNFLARQVADVYRAKLQNELEGSKGNEIARARVEAYANKIRPCGFLDHITIHAVNLGSSAPLLSNAELVDPTGERAFTSVKFHMSYTDSISISLSTAYLFNYPVSSFARLPVSLSITLDLFESSVIITPPSRFSSEPFLTISFPSEFTLNLKSTSLMGSRAMLKDVPKLHELIEHQVRRILTSKGTWKVALPALGNVSGLMENGEQGVSGESY